MFDRANTMTGIISLGISEPDMPTPKLVCRQQRERSTKGMSLALYAECRHALSFRQAIAEKSYLKDAPRPENESRRHKRRHGRFEPAVPLSAGQNLMKSLIQDPQWLNYVAQIKRTATLRPSRVPPDAGA